MATLRLGARRPHPDHPRLRLLAALVWSIAGGLLLLLLFFMLLGAFDPLEVVAVTVAAAVVGVLWLAHAWPRLRAGGGDRRDRERRGF